MHRNFSERKVRKWGIVLISLLAIVGFSCGGSEKEEATAKEIQPEGKGDYLDIINRQGAENIFCQETDKGVFNGPNRAAFYKFKTNGSKNYTLIFDGYYQDHRGIKIEVYRSDTGELVARSYDENKSRATLSLSSLVETEFYVVVSAIQAVNKGKFYLSLECQ